MDIFLRFPSLFSQVKQNGRQSLRKMRFFSKNYNSISFALQNAGLQVTSRR